MQAAFASETTRAQRRRRPPLLTEERTGRDRDAPASPAMAGLPRYLQSARIAGMNGALAESLGREGERAAYEPELSREPREPGEVRASTPPANGIQNGITRSVSPRPPGRSGGALDRVNGVNGKHPADLSKANAHAPGPRAAPEPAADAAAATPASYAAPRPAAEALRTQVSATATAAAPAAAPVVELSAPGARPKASAPAEPPSTAVAPVAAAKPVEAKDAAAKQSDAAARAGAEAAEKSAKPAAAKARGKPGAAPAKPFAPAAAQPGAAAAAIAPELAASTGGEAATATASAPSGESAAAGGGAAAADLAGGSLDESEGPADAADESALDEKFEAASPEQAEADAAAEAEDDPEGAALLEPEPEPTREPASPAAAAADVEALTGTSASADEILAAGGSTAEPATDRIDADVPSSVPAAAAEPPTIEPAAEELAPPAPAPVEEPEPADNAVAAQSTDEGLDAAEQRAALDALASGAGPGGGEPSGGGGGGGAAIEDEPEQEAPDVSGQEPEAALASVENLPPGKLVGALGGVSSAVDESVGKQHAELAANPPEMERPSGSPVTKSAPGAAAGVTTAGAKRSVGKGREGAPQPVPQPMPLPAPPPSPAARAPEPRIASSGETELGENEARAIRSSVRNMPVTDPGLNVDAGPAPQVKLAGDADPAQMQDQSAKLNDSATEAQAEGRRDAAQPMGEDEIYPTIEPETLRAQKGGGEGGGAAAGAGAAGAGGGEAGASGGGDADEAAAIIAKEQNGPELKAAAAQAKSQMADHRAAHAEKAADERAKNQKEIAQLERENAAEQAAESTKARGEVAKAREDWSTEQQEEIDDANEEARRVQEEGDKTIATEEQQANEEALEHIDAGNEEAADHRTTAEDEAERKRREADEESSGVFGWLASKAKAFFDRVKRGITAVFDAARRLVKAAIEKAKKLAVAVIEKARKAIVAAIRAVGAALIAIGDRLLAAFPALREKWRKFIQEKVDAAEAAVNRLADALKAGVQKLLDFLGKALDAALGLLQKGLLAVVSAYEAAVKGIIKAAKAVADAIGAFVRLIKDVAAGPARWIRNLGAGVVDGIRNHLWKALKTAVRNWFNSKLEEVLGITGVIWGLLKKGGIAVKDVGQMAWEGLKAAIPMALIKILVEKLVAMIVPAAGAVMAIIEGLQAAWGTVSRIIAAFAKFFTFLKAVKPGTAGPPFADAVAAAAVVVIDFVANWLLKKIRGPAGKIGGRIKAIAKKIAGRLKRGASRVGKALKKAGRKALAPLKKAKAKLKAWRDKRRAAKKKKDDPAKKKAEKEKAKRERLEKAVREIQPKIAAMSRGGRLSGVMLKARLAFWRARYRLSSLTIAGDPNAPVVIARVNPEARVVAFVRKHGAALLKLIYEVADEIIKRPDVQAAIERMQERIATGAGTKADPLKVESAAESVALSQVLKEGRQPGSVLHTQFVGGGTAAVQQTRSSKPGHQFVKGGGEYTAHEQLFQDIAARSGLRSPRQVASMASQAIVGAESGRQVKSAKDAAASLALLRIVEMSRSQQAMTVSTDLAQLVGQGGMPHATAIAGDPMAPVGAVGTAKKVEEKVRGATFDPKTLEGEVKVRSNAVKQKRMLDQQIKFMASILQSRYSAENVMFTNNHALTEAVRKDVKKYLLEITGRNLGLEPLSGSPAKKP